MVLCKTLRIKRVFTTVYCSQIYLNYFLMSWFPCKTPLRHQKTFPSSSTLFTVYYQFFYFFLSLSSSYFSPVTMSSLTILQNVFFPTNQPSSPRISTCVQECRYRSVLEGCTLVKQKCLQVVSVRDKTQGQHIRVHYRSKVGVYLKRGVREGGGAGRGE